MKEKKMKFVSIGPTCNSALMLQDYNLRTEAYPFDFTFSSPKLIKHTINDRFQIYLDKKYIKGSTKLNKRGSHHTFYEIGYLDIPPILKNRGNVTNFLSKSLGHGTDGHMFNHHNLLLDKEYDSFKRRVERFMDLIENCNNNKDKVCFIYYVKYDDSSYKYITEDNFKYDDLIELSEYFYSKRNIYMY